MHVHASKHRGQEHSFFREKFRTQQYGPLAVNDESLYESMEHDDNEPFPASDNGSLPEPDNGSISEPGRGKGPMLKTKKTRRGWGKRGKKANKAIQFTLFGNNANGVKAKRESLIYSLKNYGGPSCVLIQETKLRTPGTLKIPGYQIFEKTRTGLGGGLLTAIDNNLSPVLISSGENDTEFRY